MMIMNQDELEPFISYKLYGQRVPWKRFQNSWYNRNQPSTEHISTKLFFRSLKISSSEIENAWIVEKQFRIYFDFDIYIFNKTFYIFSAKNTRI